MKRTCTATEAIELLGCSRTSFFRWVKAGQIKPRTVARSKHPVYVSTEILEFKKAHHDTALKANKYLNPESRTGGEKETSLDKVKAAEERILKECNHIFEQFPLDPAKGEDYNQAQIRKQMLALAEQERLIVRFFALLESDSEQNRLKTMESIVKYLVPLISQQKITHSPSSQWAELVTKMESIRDEIRGASRGGGEASPAKPGEYSNEFLEILQVTEMQRT